MMKSRVLIVFLQLSIFLSFFAVDAYRIAVISIPLYGHFGPLKAVGEQLSLMGHTVELLVPKKSWCSSTKAVEKNFICVPFSTFDTFPVEFWDKVSAVPSAGDSFPMLFEEMLNHHEKSIQAYLNHFADHHKEIDLFLIDSATFVGHAVATKYQKPYVSMYPFTLALQVGMATWLPAMGSGYGLKMSVSQRYYNHLHKFATMLIGPLIVIRLNKVRAEYGIAPYVSPIEPSGLFSTMLAPTIYGYDIPQAVCPNVYPLGAILPLREEEVLEDEVKAFLSRCLDQGRAVVYVNMGTLSQLQTNQKKLYRDTFTQDPTWNVCVLWKTEDIVNGLPNVLTKKFFGSAVQIMQHPATKVFVTHCGDTSVLEAVTAALPLVGVPIFADQGDVCARVVDAGMGVAVSDKNTFTSQELRLKIDTILERYPEYHATMQRLKTTSELYGGAKRAAEIIVDNIQHNTTQLAVCPYLRNMSLYQILEWDLVAVDALLLYCLYWVLKKIVKGVLRLLFGKKKESSASSGGKKVKTN
eukprot:PhF_6_TR31102/c0_g1_i1/m.45495/K00699/UGT; glucuronosyltransferase